MTQPHTCDLERFLLLHSPDSVPGIASKAIKIQRLCPH